jgi:hypothetical protein
MATLVGKLVKKFYPKTVQKIKDPQQEMMEKLMKENKDKPRDGEEGEKKEEMSADVEREDNGDDEEVQEL